MKASPKQITRLLNTAKGQINGILKMIEEDQYCIDISNQIMAVEGVLKKANQEVIKAHLEHCVKDAVENGDVKEKINEIETTIINEVEEKRGVFAYSGTGKFILYIFPLHFPTYKYYCKESAYREQYVCRCLVKQIKEIESEYLYIGQYPL